MNETERPLPPFIDVPTRFDTLATWERHLSAIERLPEETLLRNEMLQGAWQVIPEERPQA